MVQTTTQFLSIVREVSLESVAHEAQQPPRLLVVAAPADGRALAERLVGPEFEHFVSIADEPPADALTAFDAVIIGWSGSDGARLRRQVAAARQHGWPVLIMTSVPASVPPDLSAARSVHWSHDPFAAVDEARQALVETIDESRWPALGRYFPQLRQATARELVLATARVNAQFSGISAAAGLVPLLGTLVSIGGDFLVLTKNQVLMLFKLAALHGRDLDDRPKLYLEMGSVIGIAFGWRTLARGVLGFIPGPVGLIPRVGIAYGGTLAVGMAAHAYYHEGRLPTTADLLALVQATREWVRRRRLGAADDQLPPSATTRIQEAPPTPTASAP